MSKRTYVDSPHNATEGWKVEADELTGEGDDLYFVMVPDEGSPGGYRRHTASWNTGRTEPDELLEMIENIQQDLDEDYNRYREENHHEIMQQERYELWKNEY